MFSEKSVKPETTPIRNTALILGASVLSTTALVTYALVKDSGASVVDLGRDVWNGIKPENNLIPNKVADSMQEKAGHVVKLLRDEIVMFDRTVGSHFRGGRQ